MSLFSPIPVASSSRRTRLLDMETNIRRAVTIVGGTAYTNGASTGVLPGAVAKDNLKVSKWVPLSRLSEPYHHVVFQGFIKSLVGSDAASLAIPGIGFIKNAVGVEYGLVYTYCSGSNFSGSLGVSICGTAMTTKTLTALAPMALSTQSISGALWTPNEDPAGNFVDVTLTNSSAGVTITDCLFTLVIKAKHI
jgi:hypothetical protein